MRAEPYPYSLQSANIGNHDAILVVAVVRIYVAMMWDRLQIQAQDDGSGRFTWWDE